MKTLLCRMLALTFLLNVLTPDARLFAQARKGIPQQNLTGSNINYSPETDERIAKSAFANIRQYDPATNTYKKWNPSFVDEANLRLFLHNAPDEAFLDYIIKHKLPADTWTFGMNEYVPGFSLQQTSEKVNSVVLRRLNLMMEEKNVNFLIVEKLLESPSDEVASFAALALTKAFRQFINDRETNLFFATNIFPRWQQTVLKRLETAAAEKNNSAVLAPRSAAESLMKEQYRPVENIALRGNLHLLLATMRDIYRNLNTSAPQTGGVSDLLTPSKYKELTDGILNSVDYTRTHKEWWMGSNATRLLNAEYAAINLIAYDGIDGFERLVDFYESQNKITKFQTESPTSFNLKKVSLPQQSVINTANFTQMQRAFSSLAAEYGPQVADRQQAMDPKELSKLRNVLLKYANNGSAPARVLALSMLADFYAKSGAKGISASGYDKGAKSGPFISSKMANQVADLIKEKYYCPLVRSTKSGVFGLNAQEMLTITQMLGDAYNGVRQDPQSYVVEKGKSAPCYVRLKQSSNLNAQAEDLTEDVMWFVISWWGIGAAFKAISAGASAAGNVARAAKIAAKSPARVQPAAFKAALKEAAEASKLARGLAKDGITVERVVLNSKGDQVVRNMTQMRVPASSEQTLGYVVTQRLPGGLVTTRSVDAATNMSRLLTDGKTVLGAPNGPFSQFFNIANDALSTLPKAGAQRAAYRSVIATEDLMQAGLKTLGTQNMATGYKMFQKLVPDANGKLVVENTPVFLRLSPTDPLAHYNSAGQILTGNVRADLLASMERPGAVLTASLYEPAVEGLNYFKWITGFSARFYAYDLASQPVLDKWKAQDANKIIARQVEGMTEEEMAGPDGKSPFVPEKSYTDYFMEHAADGNVLGGVLGLIGQGISRVTSSAAKWIFLPKVAPEERAALLEKNPYMQMYRAQLKEWEEHLQQEKEADELLKQYPQYSDEYDQEFDETYEENNRVPEAYIQDVDKNGNLVVLTQEAFDKRYPDGEVLVHDTDHYGDPVLRTKAAYKKVHAQHKKEETPAQQQPAEKDNYTELEDYI